MEITVRQLIETEAYNIQKAIIQREVNFGDPKREYFADQRVFKKSKEEIVLLANLKHKWLKEMRRKYPDFVKRKSTKKEYLQTTNNFHELE